MGPAITSWWIDVTIPRLPKPDPICQEAGFDPPPWYVTGVHKRFHGQKNPRTPEESFAVSIFRQLERFARDKAGCLGLFLWVRADNDRAIAFYRKIGFVDDPAGPVQRDGGAPHLTMRKLLEDDASEQG